MVFTNAREEQVLELFGYDEGRGALKRQTLEVTERRHPGFLSAWAMVWTLPALPEPSSGQCGGRLHCDLPHGPLRVGLSWAPGHISHPAECADPWASQQTSPPLRTWLIDAADGNASRESVEPAA